jgi:hypothetical protein
LSLGVPGRTVFVKDAPGSGKVRAGTILYAILLLHVWANLAARSSDISRATVHFTVLAR